MRALLAAVLLSLACTASSFVGGPALYGGGAASFIPCGTGANVANCVLWLDGSDSSTITIASGFVSAWADKSGAGISATQATPAKGPTYSSNVQNGKNALYFDGGTNPSDGNNADWLSSSSANLLRSVSGWTMFMVLKPSQNTATKVIIQIDTGSSTARAAFVQLVTTGYYRGTGRRNNADTGALVTTTTQANTSTPVVLSMVADFSATTGTLYQNGTQIGQNTSWLTSGSTPNDGGVLTVGDESAHNLPYHGYIYEILLYSRALTSIEHAQVVDYLKFSWGLMMSPFAFWPWRRRRAANDDQYEFLRRAA